MRVWRTAVVGPLLVVTGLIFGCADNPANLRYLGDANLSYYRDAATQIDYAAVESHTLADVLTTEPPRVVSDPREDEIRDITLAEAMQIAIQNSAVIRNRNLLTPGTNRVTANPEAVATIYDPAIQESGVLFGGRGLESALSAFDARWTTSMIWGRDEQVQNNQFFSGGLMGGSTLIRESGVFSTRLQKLFANGGSFAVTHDWNYQGVNVPGQLFPSSYTGSVGAEYRLPLLAGAGTEYTRIAGPIANSFGGITGVNQGVVITRINNDISLADFELSVRNLLKDVEDAYWDLYLQYRLYDTAVKTRNSTLEIWRKFKITLDLGGNAGQGISVTAEPQAREQYYETRAAAATALGNLYTAEVVLRRLIGLSSNDGLVLRPSDEPPLAEFVPDWEMSLVDALTNRTELRRQKFNIKSLELQLQAANSLVRPRLDFVSGYRVNGFGDQLLSQSDNDGGRSAQGLNSAYETITQGDQTGWNLGLEMTMDLGFRSANAQVRNVELRLAKARELLAAQEVDISHEMSIAFQDVATNYAAAQANFNRQMASEKRIQLFAERRDIESFDLILRAQLSLAQAEAAFYTNMTNYAKSIAAFHFAKGDLLEFNNVHLAESMWTPNAYDQALRRAISRSHAIGNPFLSTEPAEFTYPAGDHVITVDPAEPVDALLPGSEPLPAEMPAPTAPRWDKAPSGIQPVPNAPEPKTLKVPAYEPPLPGVQIPTPVNPLPEEATQSSTSSIPASYRSSNLARLRAKRAEDDLHINLPTSSGLTGTKVGSLKPTPPPKGPIEQTGYFQEKQEVAVPESLELDAERDLLQ